MTSTWRSFYLGGTKDPETKHLLLTQSKFKISSTSPKLNKYNIRLQILMIKHNILSPRETSADSTATANDTVLTLEANPG